MADKSVAVKLLAEFPPVSTQDWDAAINKDLKGADYEKRLVWRPAEGMPVRPYYRREDIAALDWTKTQPGVFPYVRGNESRGGWKIRERIDIADPIEANRAARAAVAAGAEEIAFGKVNIANVSDYALLFAELDEVPVKLVGLTLASFNRLQLHLKKVPRKASIFAAQDPFHDIELTAQIALAAPPELIPFTIDGATKEEMGANGMDEIGIALAAGVDYLAEMDKLGIEACRAASLLEFSLSIGRNYFFQIGKLRAFRMLWARVVESFGAPPECGRARIVARTSRWSKTVYDPHVNVLRGTVDAMAAIIGGADSVYVTPFDDCYKKPDAASRRLARNTQIILKREAMLGRVADPGGGSYALETITNFLANEGWKRMQEIEARGGYRKAADWIQERLDQSMVARDHSVAIRRRVFVGTNMYANPAEKAQPHIDSVRANAVRRATQAYEELRLRTERSDKTPRILLVEIGDAKMRAARSSFAYNFFTPAGFDVVAQRFKSVGEILPAAADAIVLCSSDAEYAALAAELLSKLKDAGRTTPVLIAGNPDNTEELKAAGVADFIHVRSNPLEVLAGWQQRLGVKES